MVPGKNVVDVGKKVDAKLNEVMSLLPLGVQVETIYAQHTAVEESITEFLRNLILSVLTVITALCVFMGWRAGTVVECSSVAHCLRYDFYYVLGWNRTAAYFFRRIDDCYGNAGRQRNCSSRGYGDWRKERVDSC